MSLQNTSKQFGCITKTIHWSIFILFVVQYFLVYRREYFSQDSPEKLQYILLHKSIGVCVLLLAFLMILWRHAGTRPSYPTNTSSFERGLAKGTHFLLYVVLLLQPITGILMSSFSGRNISVFEWFTLPNYFAKNEALAKAMFETHVIASFVIIGLVGLHALAALYHHFIRKDNVLKRMI